MDYQSYKMYGNENTQWFSFDFSISNTRYTFSCMWNKQIERWIFSVSNDSGRICSGLKVQTEVVYDVVSGVSLFFSIPSSRKDFYPGINELKNVVMYAASK